MRTIRAWPARSPSSVGENLPLADTLLLHIAKDAVFKLLETDMSFARALLAGLSMRLHSLISDVESYSLRSSAQRVIGYLLQHCPQESELIS